MDIESYSLSEESSDESRQKTCHLSEECLQKNLKIKHAKEEHINLMQGANIDQNLRGSFDSGDIDNVLSGESLYKTFTFEQTSDEDIAKCMGFWTTVMQKNLEPIKCTIVQSTEARTAKAEVEKKPSEQNIEEINVRIKEAETKIHDHYKNMWMTVLKKIQKNKLDEIKMYAKSRCKMCETLIPPKDYSSNRDEIIQLNNWMPKTSTGPIPPKKVHSKQEPICVCERILKSEKSDISTLVSAGRPKDNNTYILKDVIIQKKKSGAYSRWRDNTLESCTCGADPCECNKNPAIVSIEPPDTTCGCKQLDCQCQLKTLEIVAAEEEDLCTCGHVECVCNSKTEFPDSQSESKSGSLETIWNEGTASKPSLPGEILPSKFKSKDTPSEASPDHTALLFDIDNGPLKKDNKADVTKEGSDKGSRTTLDMSKCHCEECQCEKDNKSDLERQEENMKKEEGSKHDKDKQSKKCKNYKKKTQKRSKKQNGYN